MRKPAFCICKNKGADQLRGNRAADQHLCFHYIDKENPSLVFSGDREIPTRGSTVPVGNEAWLRRVSHWNGGPKGWDFPVPLYTNDRFYFSHI